MVDDHPMIRAGLTLTISPEPDMTVVASASTGREGLEQYRQHQPDITLMDLRMPEMGGVEAIRTIRIVALTRSQVAFTSTLPRKGRVAVCPECDRILPVELSGLM